MRTRELLLSFTLSTLLAEAVSPLEILASSIVLGADYNVSLPATLATMLHNNHRSLSTIGSGLLLAPRLGARRRRWQ